MTANLRRARQILRHRRLAIGLAALAFLIASPGFLVGWQMDDYMIRFNIRNFEGWGGTTFEAPSLFGLSNGDPELLKKVRDLGAVPWWTPDDLRLAFWRPLAEWTHRLDAALARDSAAVAHLHSLLWFALTAVLVLETYRRLFQDAGSRDSRAGATVGWAAGLAALLWIIDDARAMPAGWVANRNALLALFFGLLTLLLHREWRTRGTPTVALLACASLALSLLSAEAGIGATAYLFAFACFLDPDRRWTHRLAALLPYALVVVGWRLAYQLQGFGADGGRFYLDPVRQPLEFAGALVERVPVLFLGQWGLPPAESALLLPPHFKIVGWILGLLLAALLTLAARALLRSDARARFLALGMALAFVPICAVQPGDRNLGFVGFGAAGLLALYLAGLGDRSDWTTTDRTPRRLRRTLVAALVVVHLILAPLLFPIMIWGVTSLGDPVTEAAAAVPIDEWSTDSDLVLVNAPDFFYADMVSVYHGLAGRELPRTIRPLALGPTPLRVTRLDDRSLRIHFERGMPGGMFAGLFRGPDNALRAGDRVELPRLRIEVENVLETGRISTAVFRWDRALDASSIGWLSWEDDHFVPFSPPAVGETVILPAAWSPIEAQIHGAFGSDTS